MHRIIQFLIIKTNTNSRQESFRNISIKASLFLDSGSSCLTCCKDIIVWNNSYLYICFTIWGKGKYVSFYYKHHLLHNVGMGVIFWIWINPILIYTIGDSLWLLLLLHVHVWQWVNFFENIINDTYVFFYISNTVGMGRGLGVVLTSMEPYDPTEYSQAGTMNWRTLSNITTNLQYREKKVNKIPEML